MVVVAEKAARFVNGIKPPSDLATLRIGQRQAVETNHKRSRCQTGGRDTQVPEAIEETFVG